jgi:cyclase
MGDGHSDNDSVLWLPQDDVVFMSDLLYIGCHLYLGAGNPGSLLRILDAIRVMRPTIVMPGNGPVGGPEDFVKMAQ